MIDIDHTEQDEAARLIQFVQPKPFTAEELRNLCDEPFRRGGHNCRHSTGEPIIPPVTPERLKKSRELFNRILSGAGTQFSPLFFDWKQRPPVTEEAPPCQPFSAQDATDHQMDRTAPNCPTCGARMWSMWRKAVGPAHVSRTTWKCGHCPIDTAPEIEDVEAMEVKPLELPPHGDGLH